MVHNGCVELRAKVLLALEMPAERYNPASDMEFLMHNCPIFRTLCRNLERYFVQKRVIGGFRVVNTSLSVNII